MSAKRAVAVDPIAQAIYEGIRSVMPVDVIGYMGQKRADEYAALWATAAAKRVAPVVTEAEKRGAIKALRLMAEHMDKWSEGHPTYAIADAVAYVGTYADLIEAGTVTA